MKKSDEALAIAALIAEGENVFYCGPFLNDFVYGMGRTITDLEFSIEHQIIALCFYAEILNDEGE